MDTQNNVKKADSVPLAAVGNHRVVVGSKQLRKALTKGLTQRVFLASNADPAITEPIEELCKEHCVQYTWVPSMADLGHACGIDVGAAAAAVIDPDSNR